MPSTKAVSRLSAAAVVTLIGGWMTAVHGVTIDWVTVGNPGNAGETRTYLSGGTLTCGAVDEAYRIMQFEFTNAQYAAFLNAIDPEGTNPNEVYSGAMGSEAEGGIMNTGTTSGSRYVPRANMGSKPVVYVSWFDAARVANWLHHGARMYGTTDSSASAPQNTGAYSVGTATNGSAVARNTDARYWVPTEDEWYKAAFYNPTLNGGAGGYTVYGNGFSTTPTPVTADAVGDGSAGPIGNFANYDRRGGWNGQDGAVTTVGTNGGAGWYGAFDMSGNVWEWNDLSGIPESSRGFRGGGWYNGAHALDLSSSIRFAVDPSFGFDASTGFRLAGQVAAVPEPATWVMGLGGGVCAAWGAWRRRRRSDR